MTLVRPDLFCCSSRHLLQRTTSVATEDKSSDIASVATEGKSSVATESASVTSVATEAMSSVVMEEMPAAATHDGCPG